MTAIVRHILCALFLVVCMSVKAVALDDQTKIDLQSSLLRFLEAGSDAQGAFTVIDRESGELLRVFAGAMHPKIVPLGDDQVLCIEMFDVAGNRHDADFVMRRSASGWLVVDVLFNQRPLLKKAIGKLR